MLGKLIKDEDGNYKRITLSTSEAKDVFRITVRWNQLLYNIIEEEVEDEEDKKILKKNLFVKPYTLLLDALEEKVHEVKNEKRKRGEKYGGY